MASPRIVPSDLAPDEVVHYDLAGVEFDLGGSAESGFETDNRAVIGNAEAHPWLKVEYPEVEVIAGVQRDTLANHPELDVLSGVGPNAGAAFDPEAIAAVENAKREMEKSRLAVNADLDQHEAQTVGTEGAPEVAVTLAADDAHEAASSADEFHHDEDEGND